MCATTTEQSCCHEHQATSHAKSRSHYIAEHSAGFALPMYANVSHHCLTSNAL